MFGIGPTHGNPEIGAGRQIYRCVLRGQRNLDRRSGGVDLYFYSTAQFNICQINGDVSTHGAT